MSGTALQPMDEAAFRTMFPMFWDAAKFPSATIVMWLAVATRQINPRRWMDLTPLGIGLWTAHTLALNTREGGPGSSQTPGMANVGVMTSKSGGGVSASYDVSQGSIEGAGDMNLTIFGRKLARLNSEMGAGPIQVSGTLPAGVLLDGGALGGFWGVELEYWGANAALRSD